MYLPTKLFRGPQPSLHLLDSQVSYTCQSALLSVCSYVCSPVCTHICLCVPQRCVNKVACVLKRSSVQASIALTREVSGGVDHQALVQMLRTCQNLQDQADILYIFYKDKYLHTHTHHTCTHTHTHTPHTHIHGPIQMAHNSPSRYVWCVCMACAWCACTVCVCF